VPGEYTKSFKSLDEREQQRLINREISLKHELEPIKKSDRPELAETIFENPERQALYIGNLNPNMIKYVWYNEKLHKMRRTDGEWIRYNRKNFIKKLGIDTKRSNMFVSFLPNDDFDMKKIIDLYKGDINNPDFKRFVKFYLEQSDDYRLKELDFFPKQINQIKKLREEGFFKKYYDN
jgi:hypothetical protein